MKLDMSKEEDRQAGRRLQLLVNGEPQKWAVAFDTETGWFRLTQHEGDKPKTGPWLLNKEGRPYRRVLYEEVFGVPFQIRDRMTGMILAAYEAL